MKVSLIGVGLMGGSLSLSLQKLNCHVNISGISRKETTLKKAQSLGLIHQIGSMNDLINADLVVIAIPVEATVTILPKVLDHIGSKTLVLDMGSTKASICSVVADHPKRNQFLACHPIAGTEYSGPEAAIPDLYTHKTTMLCEVEKTKPELLERAIDLFNNLKMNVRTMDPMEHDRHIAYVSHLSHISSFMLGKTVMEKERNERNIFDMAGSGFSSTVRLAKSSPDMWLPIFKQNKDNVLETMNEYIGNLQKFKSLLEKDAYNELHQQMEQINLIKNILKD